MDINEEIARLEREIRSEQILLHTRNIISESRAQFPGPFDKQMPAWDEEAFQARVRAERYTLVRPRPEPKVHRPVRFRWQWLVLPLLLVAFTIGAPFVPQKAEAAIDDCAGDTLSSTCTQCVVSEASSTPCGSRGDAERRLEAMQETMGGITPKRRVRHGIVAWPVTGDEAVMYQNMGAEKTARMKATRTEKTQSPESLDQQSSGTPSLGEESEPEQESRATAPVAYTPVGGSDSEFPLTGGQMLFLGILCAGGLILATRHFSPSLYQAGVGKVHGLNSTMLPHAKDARRGLNKFLPGLAWMMDFKTMPGMLAKFGIVLAGTWYVWHALGSLVGPWLRLVAILVILVGLGRIDARKAQGEVVNTERWWDPTEMSKAMIAAGIVTAPKMGAPMPMTRAVGGPQADQYGTTAKFDPPGGIVLAHVMKRHASLAKALRVPADRLEVTQGDNDPEGTLTFWVGIAQAREVVSASVPEEGRHSADSDFVLGRGLKGEPISMRTRNRQTLVAGQPGSGKTSLVRRMILHWLADPKALVFVFDGKSNTDYVDGVKQFSAYVTQFGPVNHDYVAQTEQLLTEVNRIVNERNESRTVDKSGVLVVLDEFQEVLADADRAGRERLEKLMASVTKRGRMANVHVVLATQEVRGDTIPTKVRAMFQQIIGFRVGRTTEEPIIFGQQVSTKRPKADGELVIMSQGGESWVKSDFLDEPQWAEAVQAMAHREPVRLTEVKPLPGLVLAVLDLLEEEDGLEPAALFERLSEDVRTGTAASMGKALAKHGITSKKEAGRNVYRLAAVRAAVQGA